LEFEELLENRKAGFDDGIELTKRLGQRGDGEKVSEVNRKDASGDN
jgi:hypothetical protein